MAAFPPEEVAYEEPRANDSRQAVVYGVASTFFIIAVAIVLFRLLSRKVLNAKLALDDYLIVGALFTSIPFTAATLSAAKYGIGRHITTLTADDFVEGAKWNIVNVFSYGASMTLVKLSMLALYDRIFGSAHPRFRILLAALAAYAVLWVLGLYLGYGLSCQPFWRYWSLTDGCASSKTYGYAGAILDAVHDILVFAAPQALIWRLQLSPKRRLAISAVLCVGLIATVMGIVKAVYAGGAPNVAHPLDATWNSVTALVANALEVYLAMSCACLPALPGLVSWIRTEGFSNIASKVFGSTSSVPRISSGSRTKSAGRRSGSNADKVPRAESSEANIYVQTEVSITSSNTKSQQDIEMGKVSQVPAKH